MLEEKITAESQRKKLEKLTANYRRQANTLRAHIRALEAEEAAKRGEDNDDDE